MVAVGKMSREGRGKGGQKMTKEGGEAARKGTFVAAREESFIVTVWKRRKRNERGKKRGVR